MLNESLKVLQVCSGAFIPRLSLAQRFTLLGLFPSGSPVSDLSCEAGRTDLAASTLVRTLSYKGSKMIFVCHANHLELVV